MRIILATVIVAGVLCGVPAWAEAPVGKGKVYSGSEGEWVAVIPVTTSWTTATDAGVQEELATKLFEKNL